MLVSFISMIAILAAGFISLTGLLLVPVRVVIAVSVPRRIRK